MDKREFVITIAKDIMIAYINKTIDEQNLMPENFGTNFSPIIQTITEHYNSFDKE